MTNKKQFDWDEYDRGCTERMNFLIDAVKPKNPKVKKLCFAAAVAAAGVALVSGYLLILAVAGVSIILGMAAKS